MSDSAPVLEVVVLLGEITTHQMTVVRQLQGSVAVAHPDGTVTVIAHARSTSPAVYQLSRAGRPVSLRVRPPDHPRAIVLGDPLAAFASNLRAERLAQSRTQEAVAAAAGMSTSYLGRLERAEVDPGVRTVARVAAALAVAASDLVDGSKRGGGNG